MHPMVDPIELHEDRDTRTGVQKAVTTDKSVCPLDVMLAERESDPEP